MGAKQYATLFLFAFFLFFATPPIVKTIEKTVDVFYFLDVAEEEKKRESETNQKIFIVTFCTENYKKTHKLSNNEVIFAKKLPPPKCT